MEKRSIMGAFGALLVAALPLCGLADDSYILWLQIVQPEASAVLFNFARVAHAEDMEKTYKTTSGEDGFWSNEPGRTSTVVQYIDIGTFSDVGTYDGLSFIVELFAFTSGNYSTYESVAQSGVISFASVKSAIAPNGSNPTSVATVSAFTIPEPTSGLMMLLGLAVLGLKRKRT